MLFKAPPTNFAGNIATYAVEKDTDIMPHRLCLKTLYLKFTTLKAYGDVMRCIKSVVVVRKADNRVVHQLSGEMVGTYSYLCDVAPIFNRGAGVYYIPIVTSSAFSFDMSKYRIEVTFSDEIANVGNPPTLFGLGSNAEQWTSTTAAATQDGFQCFFVPPGLEQSATLSNKQEAVEATLVLTDNDTDRPMYPFKATWNILETQECIKETRIIVDGELVQEFDEVYESIVFDPILNGERLGTKPIPQFRLNSPFDIKAVKIEVSLNGPKVPDGGTIWFMVIEHVH